MTTAMEQALDLYGDPANVVRRVADAVRRGTWHGSEEVPARCSGALYYRELPDGREIAVYPLIAGTVRVVIGPAGYPTYDDAWCYSVPIAGLAAAACWDGEGDPPTGWFRNIKTGRRRPEGDPAREYIAH